MGYWSRKMWFCTPPVPGTWFVSQKLSFNAFCDDNDGMPNSSRDAVTLLCQATSLS